MLVVLQATVNKQPTISMINILIIGIHVDKVLFGSPNILNDVELLSFLTE